MSTTPQPIQQRSKLVIATLWVVLTLIVTRASTAIQSIFLSRVFSKEEVGLLSVMFMLNAGIHAFTELGHEAALIHRKDENLDRAINTAWVGAILRGFCLFMMLFSIAPWVAEFYGRTELTALIQGSALYFLIIGFKNLHLVKLTRAMNFARPKLLSSIAMSAGLIITLISGVYFRSIWCVIYGGLTQRMITVIGSHLIAPIGIRFSFNKPDFMELFRYGRHIQIVGILVFLVTQFDNAVIGKLLSMSHLAVYTNAYLLANLPMTQIVGIASQVAFPAWSQVSREGTIEQRNQMFLSTLRLTTVLSVSLCLFLGLGGADLIEIIFGARWREAESPLRILLLFGLWRGIGSNFGALFNAIGKPHMISIEISVKFIVIASIIYPLTDNYGLLGASWAVALPMGLITPIALWIYLGLAEVNRRQALHCLVFPFTFALLLIVIWYFGQAWLWTYSAVWIKGMAIPFIAFSLCFGACLLCDTRLRTVLFQRS
jgi:lipopolysaccharide exporter